MNRFARITAAVTSSFFGLVALAHAQSSNANALQNPLNSDFSSVPDFVAGVLKIMVEVALPIISLFVVYSGFLFVVAQGNEEAIGKAKRNFLYVIVGAILILGAWVIATLIGGTVTQITGTTTQF